MSLLLWREFRAFTVLACIVTFTTFLFSYTLRDSSLHFNYAIYKSGSFFSNGQCGCRQCMTELEDDPWFTERFNHSVHPLMSRRNSLLTNDTYHWWQRLQGEQDPANFSEVVEKLFQIIPDDDDDLYMDAGPERCRTCAVVGNSGNLNKSHYGPLIDSSDVIIRMNMAPTSGFEEDVGSRTTHHVMYPESAMDLDNTTSLLLIPFKTLDLQWITSALTTGSIKQTYVPVPSRIKANKNKVLILNPTFFKYVYNTWLESNGRYPSTGFLSLLFAVHICDKVNVFGFGADRYGNWHHYWEKNQHGGAFRKTGVHDADYEYNVTLLLADKHKINNFKGF